MAYGHANRGSALEGLIELANKQYRNKNIARVDKVPTPTKVLSNGSGFYSAKSTVDFTGVIKGGQFICFDTKETAINTSFPLKNIHSHQMEYMQDVINMGGISFFIVGFSKLNEYYRLDFEVIKKYWERWEENKGKKGFGSIPKDKFDKVLKQGNGLVLDYLLGIV